MTGVAALARVDMICGDPRQLAEFYAAAFGFGHETDAEGIALTLGRQRIGLRRMPPGGRPYPDDVAGWSPLFQHCAIIVAEMTAAYARLAAVPGWTAISTAGPQRLPAASGGATAFKFRDPDGHPLELLAFPAHATPPQWVSCDGALCLGIDHSAISVADTAASIAFYAGLGLAHAGGSLNHGMEQAQLDGVPGAVVEVTALAPPHPTPHVELLCYRGSYDRRAHHAAEDASATRLVFSVDDRAAVSALCTRLSLSIVQDDAGTTLLRDPDGHLICLEAI